MDINQGIEQGKKEEESRKEIAKKMKQKGLECKLIQEVTGLTEEEINAL